MAVIDPVLLNVGIKFGNCTQESLESIKELIPSNVNLLNLWNLWCIQLIIPFTF